MGTVALWILSNIALKGVWIEFMSYTCKLKSIGRFQYWLQPINYYNMSLINQLNYCLNAGCLKKEVIM